MFDADGHVFEKGPEIFEYLEAPFKGRRRLLRVPLFPQGDDWNRTALAIAGDYSEGSNTAREEEGAPEQWLEVLDQLGLEGTVLYPTSGMTIGRIKHGQWAIAVCKAYNDWLSDRFLRVSPRLKAVGLIPMTSPVDAAAEMRRVTAQKTGFVGFFLSAGVDRPLGDPFYDPIYETAEALDVMLAVHAGGPGHRFDMFDRAIMARCLGHPTSQMVQLVHMMFSGVFDRFRRLRFAFMEAGTAWALLATERMEEAYEQWSFEVPELKRTPRQHVTSGRIFFHCETDEAILGHVIEVWGDGQLLYASDYPHIAPNEVERRLRHFQSRADLSEKSKARILGKNAKRLYNLNDAVANTNFRGR